MHSVSKQYWAITTTFTLFDWAKINCTLIFHSALQTSNDPLESFQKQISWNNSAALWKNDWTDMSSNLINGAPRALRPLLQQHNKCWGWRVSADAQIQFGFLQTLLIQKLVPLTIFSVYVGNSEEMDGYKMTCHALINHVIFPLLHRVWWKSSRHRLCWRQWFGRCFRVRSETSKPSNVMCAELLHFPTLLTTSTTPCAKAMSHKRLYRTVLLPHGNTRTFLAMDAFIMAF